MTLARPLTERTAPAPASSTALTFAQRPGFGTIGNRTLIKANHFLVELSDRDIHHYDVSITPEVKSVGLNREIMRALLWSEGETNFRGLQPAYDGRKGLYTAGPLPFTLKDFVARIVVDEAGCIRNPRKYKVTIKLASRVKLDRLREFLRNRVGDAPHEIIQVLDVVLRENPSKNFEVIGRSFFTSGLGQPVNIGKGVQCWKGFYQSLRPTQKGLSLNIDVSAKSFYAANTHVHEFVMAFLNRWDTSMLGSCPPLSKSECEELNKVLRGVKVKVEHGAPRCYKITKLSTQPTNELEFLKHDGSKKSVVAYFQERYGIELDYGSWPSLQSGSDAKPIYLPMEICQIVGGQRYVKKLNNSQVTNLLEEACERPIYREKKIERIARLNCYEKGDLEHEFGIYVKNGLTCIDARVLPPPTLKYHDSTITPHLGQWNMINTRMFHGATVKSWRCINFSSLSEDRLYWFCDSLIAISRSKGMDFTSQPYEILSAKPHEKVEEVLALVHSMCLQQRTPLQLLLIILPEINGSSSYRTIKRICETELGIITQCCRPDKLEIQNQHYLENLVLKMNVKLGGCNTVLDRRFMPLVSDHPTIIFGADVSHPQAGEDSSASIAAVVASMDWPYMTKYKALFSAQQHRQEIIQDLYKVEQEPGKEAVHSGMISELLIAFLRSTNLKPERIIFYRDGVSEGQFSKVLHYEMDAIRKACASLQDGYLPPVTFVVVQKRHHTRLFPTNPSESVQKRGHTRLFPTNASESENVLPGTVVDSEICHPTGYDFYLCSHAGIQGTSRPAHYHVLFDENGFSPDQIQTLTNNLCYTYARCTRSVSVVPPAYYAHLAASRGRWYVKGDGGATDSDSCIVVKNPVRPLPSICPEIEEFMFYC